MKLGSAAVRAPVEVAVRVRFVSGAADSSLRFTSALLGFPASAPTPSTSSAGGGRPKARRPKPNKGAQCIPALASCIIANAWSRVKVLGF